MALLLLLDIWSLLLPSVAGAAAKLLLPVAQLHARARGASAPVIGAREPPPRREARRQAHLCVRALGSAARAVGGAVDGDKRDPRKGGHGAGRCGSNMRVPSRFFRAPRRSSPVSSFVVGRMPTPASACEHLDEAVGRHVESVFEKRKGNGARE